MTFTTVRNGERVCVVNGGYCNNRIIDQIRQRNAFEEDEVEMLTEIRIVNFQRLAKKRLHFSIRSSFENII